MTEFLITLMNAPKAVQRAIAIAGIVILGAMAAFLTVSALSIFAEKAANIKALRRELFHLEQIIARKPSDNQVPILHLEQIGLFIEGDSLPVMQARLQERLNAIASAAGVTVTTISGLSKLEMDGATYAGVRADLEGSFRGVHELVRQLETSKPPLIIRQAAIRGTNTISQGVLSDPLQLAGQILIYGAVRPGVVLNDGGR